MKNGLIVALFVIIFGIIVYIFKQQKNDEIPVDPDRPLINPDPVLNENAVETTSSKISVKSDEPWVARVNSEYTLTVLGAGIFESPAAAVEKEINEIYANASHYDDIVKKYNSLSRKERRKSSVTQMILNDAIWGAREGSNKYIRYAIR